MPHPKLLTLLLGCSALSIGTVTLCPTTRAAVDQPSTTEPALPSWQREIVDWPAARAEAAVESLRPIHPGVPGERLFWNGSAPGFAYAPAFDFKPVTGAAAYRFTVLRTDKKAPGVVFEADQPWAPLTPIWQDLPPGEVHLTVQALREKGGEPMAIAGERTFYRAAVFSGPYHAPAFDFDESLRRVCLAQFKSPFFQQFKETKDDYDAGPYPSKLEGTGVILAMTILARISPRLPEADDALLIARNAARHLIRLSRSAGDALAYFPPTYASADSRAPGDTPMPKESHPDKIMMIYPAQVGECYLDLFDATHDGEFLQAAIRIAETYRKNQLPSGTWYLVADGATGKQLGMEMVPMDMPRLNIVDFLERLGVQYSRKEFLPVRDAAVKWLREHTLKTFDFTGQFEDTGSSHAAYSNLSGNTAAAVASYLFRHAKGDPSDLANAEEILRLEEDVFIVWAHPSEHGQFTPCGLEQYDCYTAVNCSAAFFMDVCLSAYEVTGKKLYLAKAISIANAITELQRTSDGNIPTWWKPGQDDGGWYNCPALCAKMMERFAHATAGLRRDAATKPPHP